MTELIEQKTNTSTIKEIDEPEEELAEEEQEKPMEPNWYQRFMINVVKTGKIPRSVAIIMDGNRRYATNKAQEKHKGHAVGLNKLEETLTWCKHLGIYELTVFALAKENLKRSKVEVDTLMGLCKDQFSRLAKNGGVFKRQQIKVRVLGDLSLVPK